MTCSPPRPRWLFCAPWPSGRARCVGGRSGGARAAPGHVSRVLRELHSAGVLEGQQYGRVIAYSLREDARPISEELRQLFRAEQQRAWEARQALAALIPEDSEGEIARSSRSSCTAARDGAEPVPAVTPTCCLLSAAAAPSRSSGLRTSATASTPSTGLPWNPSSPTW